MSDIPFSTDEKSELKIFAQNYWASIDVDAMKPVFHGPPPTDEQRAYSEEQMRITAKLTEEFHKSSGTKPAEFVIFPELEPDHK